MGEHTIREETFMDQIKTAVRKHYAGEAARDSSCCGSPASSGPCCSTGPAESTAECCTKPESSTPLGCGIPLRHAALRPGETVLDLGSGGGQEVLAAARAVGPQGRVIGVDMTPEMIAAARARAEAQGAGNVEFLPGDIESLPLPPHSVDVIISNCVINLAPDKGKVFAEMFRVLRLGGRFSVSDVVTIGELPPKVKESPQLWAGCLAGAVQRETYLEQLRAAGFREVQLRDQVETGSIGDPEQGGSCRVLSVTVTGLKPPGSGCC
jgi:arsenite methyltransferase